VDEAGMSFMIRCILSQSWIDDRINYPENSKMISLNPDVVDQLWIPQTYISNAVDDHEQPQPFVLYEISQDKKVSLASRMTAKLTCDFDLSLFPHDTQNCHIILESSK